MNNNYYDTSSTGYNVVRSQFEDSMQREGITISSYWNSNTTYECLFRHNSDSNKSRDYVNLFYPVGSGIHAGQLLNIRGETYLTINSETIENGTYRRSDATKTNTEIITFSNNQELCVPAFCEELYNALPDGGSVIKTVGGDIRLMTEDCPLSQSVGIGSQFGAMGGHWKIVNRNFRDGIARFYATQVLKEADTTYALNIIGNTKYNVRDTTQFIVDARRDGAVVNNPVISWSSPDPAIASLSAEGMVTFLTAGEVTISADWIGHDISASIDISVSEESVHLQCLIDGRDDLRAGFNRKYTAVFYDINGNETTHIQPQWSLDVPSGYTQYVRIASTSGLTATLVADEGAIGTTFKLVLNDASGAYHTAKSIEVVSTM